MSCRNFLESKKLVQLENPNNVGGSTNWTPPFYRNLQLTLPHMSGSDILVAKHLLVRCPIVDPNLVLSNVFDSSVSLAVRRFQISASLPITGILDNICSSALLELYSRDMYQDSGKMDLPGYLYKLVIPVYKDRDIETLASLYDSKMNLLYTFLVRTRGANDRKTGLALNQFTRNGYTPTGLSLMDLNSPEPDPAAFGPYPINRFTQGVVGNASWLISNLRNGILVHTGKWSASRPSPMPNSLGCVHAYAQDVEKVWQILVSIGVEVRQNTLGALPYPYTSQGLVSVYQID